MKRTVDYQVVTSGDLSVERVATLLSEKVERLNALGWEPIGGIAVVSVRRINESPFYEGMQAMVRRHII